MTGKRKPWLSPADNARIDAIKAWKADGNEGKRRWKRPQYNWAEHEVLNPNGVKVTHIPYKEEIPKTVFNEILRDAKANNWQYQQKVKNTGKAGEQKHYNPRSTRALTDVEAVACRLEYPKTSFRLLAIRFGVSQRCIENCVKGFTYKHLNAVAAPHI